MAQHAHARLVPFLEQTPPRPTPAVPSETRPRTGLTLFVSLTHSDAAAAGTSLVEVGELLQQFVHDLVPQVDTHAALTLVEPGFWNRLRSADVHAVGQHALATGLVLIPEERRVLVDGAEVDLTYREFELLAYLMRHPRRAFSRGELLTHVWGVAYPVGGRTVDTHVTRLRVKIGVHGRRIATVRGYGYRFD